MGWLLKSFWIMTALVLGMAGRVPAATSPGMAHDLTVRLEPDRHRLAAVDRISVPRIEATELAFTLAGHLSVDRVDVDGKTADFSFKKGRLLISLPPHGETHVIRIDYSGIFDDEIPVDPINTDNPGFGVTGTIGPKGTLLLAGAHWYPSGTRQGASYTITVDAPKGIVAVTSGNPLGHATEKGRTVSRWRVSAALRGVPLVAGRYGVATRRFGKVVAATYFTEPLQRLSAQYLTAVGQYLQKYAALFGPYPFAQFAVVENAFPTGYGFPSFTLMGGRVLQLPFIVHTSLGHEIAHCWWGNGVFVDPSQGNWSEGLTTYVSDYLSQERRGKGRAYRRQWLRDYAALVPAAKDFALSEFMSRTDPITKAVGYDKAAMVFHMLRRKVGEAAFWDGLREVFTRYRFKAITWTDLRRVFEERSGMRLAPFFRQWVFKPGAPRLTLSKVTRTTTDHGFEISGRVLQQAPYYETPLTLALETDQGTALHTLHLSGPRTPFALTSVRPPRRLTADPDVNLFRRLAPQEVPPTVNTIKGAPSVTIVVADHLDPSAMPLARRFSRALGLFHVRIGRAADFSTKDLNGDNLLFFGRPSKKAGVPGGDVKFALTPHGFVLDGEAYGGSHASFFGVFPHPADERRIVAIFIPGNPAVARSLTAKIPHYGKYSFLVFDDTRNRVKGTWPVENSPLSVHWPATSPAGR